MRACRGDREDGWNAVAGSVLAGAFLSRGKGPPAMAQGGGDVHRVHVLVVPVLWCGVETRESVDVRLLYTDVPLVDW